MSKRQNNRELKRIEAEKRKLSANYVESKEQLHITVPAAHTTMNEVDDAKIESQLQLSKLNKSLNILGISLTDFLSNEGVSISKPERTVKTPFGDYQVATTHLTYEQLKELCVIDPDNIRDAAERTEEALKDIIDEIGAGLQTTPIVAYVDSAGKTSIAEGSRRYDSALLRKVGLDVDYYSPMPTVEVVRWLVEVSDKKSKFSYYDKGKLFLNLMDTHNWTQAELSKQRNYTAQDISRSVKFFSAPDYLLELLPTKRLTKAAVEKFNTLTTIIESRNLKDRVLDELSELSLKDTNSPKDNALLVIKYLESLAKGKPSKTSVAPTLVFGQSEVFLSRTNVGVNLNLKKIPKDKEQQILDAIQSILDE